MHEPEPAGHKPVGVVHELKKQRRLLHYNTGFIQGKESVKGNKNEDGPVNMDSEVVKTRHCMRLCWTGAEHLQPSCACINASVKLLLVKRRGYVFSLNAYEFLMRMYTFPGTSTKTTHRKQLMNLLERK